jgi:hypothetical protein
VKKLFQDHFDSYSSTSQLLIVGCANDNAVIDESIESFFQETVNVPVPGAQDRRAAAHQVWKETVKTSVAVPYGCCSYLPSQPAKLCSTGKVSVYPFQMLDSLAESCAGLAGVALHVQLTGALQRLFDFRDAHKSPVHLSLNSSVAGLQDAKNVLEEFILWPRRFPLLIRSFFKQSIAHTKSAAHLSVELLPDGNLPKGLRWVTGILLFGPPGTNI